MSADSDRDPRNESDDEALVGELVGPEGESLAEVRRLPVRSDGPGEIEQRRVTLPAAVAAATGGFALGVAAFLLVKVLRRPSAGRRIAGRRKKLLGRDGLEIAGSRSFLVDIHMLRRN